MYKLVALDMDGTLLDENKTITNENINAIKKAKEKGTTVVIATGRPKAGVIKYCEDLKGNGDEYLINFNGAVVINYNTNEIISETLLEIEDLKYLYDLSIKYNVNIHAFDQYQKLITPKNSKYTEVEATLNQIETHIVDFNKVNDRIIKVMFIDEPDYLQSVIDKLPHEIYDKYTVVRSAPFFLEFLNKEVDKWNAVLALGNHLGIKKEEIICMGDAGNDLGMVEKAGLGIAMENAFPEVKKAAKFITKSNNESGVAYAITKFILQD